MPKLIKFYDDSTAWLWLFTMSLGIVPIAKRGAAIPS